MSAADRWLVACDLDQTLIYGRRSLRLPAGTHQPGLRPAEFLDGEPVSFVTCRAADLLQQLAGRAELVPVTTRTLQQYRRVDLGLHPRYAIAANGGHLLLNGAPDPEWERAVRRRIAATAAPLGSVLRWAERVADPRWVRTLRVADDFFVYLVAHDRSAIPGLEDLDQRLAERGWGVSVQGRKVYLVPTALSKRAALAEVAARTGPAAVVAAGDSLLDAEMLADADAAVRPAHGELHESGWRPDHLRVTRASGIRGGEQVVETLLAVVGVPVGTG